MLSLTPSPTSTATAPDRRTRVVVLVGLLLVGAAALSWLHPGSAPVDGPSWALLPLGLLVVAASLLVVRFRAGVHEDSVTLVEAVLAVLLFAYAGPQAVLVTVAAAVVTAVGRRTTLDKSAFNTAQWAFAVALGSTVTSSVAAGEGLSSRGLLGVGLGLTALWAANSLAFAAVLVVTTGRRLADVLRGLGPVIAAGWLGGFAVNAALGLLYVLAFAGHPTAVLLFPVPLLLLHAAYRGYTAARLDRQHLAGLHRAAQALSGPVDPAEAVPAFLHEVLSGFDAGTAALVLRTPTGTVVFAAVLGEGGAVTDVRSGPTPLWSALLDHEAPVRCDAGQGALGRLLAAEGHRSASAAPVHVEGAPSGCLVVLDRTGVAGVPSGELEVLVALAREAGGSFDKGRLLARMLEDRRRLSEIVGTTSDGIVTVAADGTVTSWNPAMERLTGLSCAQVVRRPGALGQLRARTVEDVPVDLARWATDGAPPAELRLSTPLGPRRVTCSYDSAQDAATGAARTLVVVARDVTPVEDLTRLRQQFSRLVEAEAAQRLVVEQLQQAVMPVRPAVDGAELGVTYVASDPTSPTGGDLYDCQPLPDGDLHLCVVDVLGHGVEATQDALTVMHTLRTVVLDGTPLEDVVARADLLLGRQAPELVATVVLARYTPSTGEVRVASGGHPPALVVSADGRVRQLEAEGGAIGWPGAGSDGVVDAALRPGDSLVLYTDGLIEARKDLVQGLEDLQEHARDVRGLPAAELSAALVDRVLQGAERRDDTLALVLRRAPAADGAAAARWRLDSTAREAATTRRAATAWLAEQGLPADEAALVLGELLANAVEHARASVELVVAVAEHRLVLEVRDDGPGMTAVPTQRAPEDAEGGRGLQIVRALSVEVDVRSDAAGSVVRAVLDARVRVA